jgi:hypothetical protein
VKKITKISIRLGYESEINYIKSYFDNNILYIINALLINITTEKMKNESVIYSVCKIIRLIFKMNVQIFLKIEFF